MFILIFSFFVFLLSVKVKKSSIVMDAFLYIYKLKLKLQAIQREYSKLMNDTQVLTISLIWYLFFFFFFLREIERVINKYIMCMKWAAGSESGEDE